MAEGIHFLLLQDTKKQLAETEVAYNEARNQLEEAIKMGDLRENSEYDAAKEAVARIVALRDELSPVMTMSTIRSNDNVSVIEEGSILHLTIYNVTSSPVNPGTAEFEALKASGTYAFDSKIMFGGTLDIHELLSDKALAADTPIGRFILGKQPGDYTVPVPAGHANLTVEKLPTTTTTEELYCDL